MAEVAEPSGESHGTEEETQQLKERSLRRPPRRSRSSVLKVSQVLLRAINQHKGLTQTALRKELKNAGYRVSRTCCPRSDDAPKSDINGTFIRVSRNNTAQYFRVWKIPKPKRKPGRPRLEVGVRSRRRSPEGPRGPRKPRVRSRTTKRAREGRGRGRGRSARAKATVRRRGARDPVRSRAKEEKRAQVRGEGRRRAKAEGRPRARKQKKPRKEKHGREKPVKRPTQESTPVKTNPTSACTKSESSQNEATGSSECGRNFSFYRLRCLSPKGSS